MPIYHDALGSVFSLHFLFDFLGILGISASGLKGILGLIYVSSRICIPEKKNNYCHFYIIFGVNQSNERHEVIQ